MQRADKQIQPAAKTQGDLHMYRKTEWARLKGLRDQFRQSRFAEPIACWFTNPQVAGGAGAAVDQPVRCLCAAICIEVERFDFYRGSLGSDGADRIFSAICQRLANSLCLSNTLPRTVYVEIGSAGPGRLTAFVAGVSGPVEAAAVAEQLRRVIGEPVHVCDHTVYLTTSVGISLQNDNDGDLFADADAALFAAKAEGSQRCTVFDSSMRSSAIRLLDLERDLRTAIARNQLHVVYQPIFRTESGNVDGFEALVRWNHPVLGPVSPADFVPIAEETGLIVSIGQHVMAEACREACRLDREIARVPGAKPLSMSVNVSKRQLVEPGLVQFMGRCLEETQLQPNRLQLEITESIVMNDAESVSPKLTELRNLGVRIAMDDFGVGHSSMHCLLQFPLDCLKIDKALIQHLTATRRHTAAVFAVVTLARDLGIQLVAEGIETAEQIELLRGMKCDLLQGFLLSRPLNPTQLRQYLGQRLPLPGAIAATRAA